MTFEQMQQEQRGNQTPINPPLQVPVTPVDAWTFCCNLRSLTVVMSAALQTSAGLPFMLFVGCDQFSINLLVPSCMFWIHWIHTDLKETPTQVITLCNTELSAYPAKLVDLFKP